MISVKKRKNGFWLVRVMDYLISVIYYEYISDSRNEKFGEHQHFSPYMYLTVVTSNEAKITDYGIFGSLIDLERLANIIRDKLKDSDVGNVFQIDSEYSKSNEAKLVFEIKEENFDPASADNFLWLNKK